MASSDTVAIGSEPWDLDVASQVAALRAGELSPVEIVDATLRRIDATEADLSAFLTVTHDYAQRRAQQLEQLELQARERLPLFGVPVAVKDEFWTAALRTTGGSSAFAQFVPDRDAVAVARLRAAGAVIVGKTNMAEFGMSIRSRNDLIGECRNPADETRTAGGSSGGSAAAVAGRQVSLALAGDAGGSTRVPAALCGAVGLHPTVGRVPRDADFGAPPLFASVGPIVRSVADAALVLQVLAGYHPSDPLSSRSPVPNYVHEPTRARAYRVGWWQTPISGQPEVAVVEMASTIVRTCEPDLWVVDELDSRFDGVADAFRTISDVERAATSPTVPPGMRAALRPETSTRLERGMRTSAVTYARALHHRARAVSELGGLFEPFDVIVSPAIGTTAPKLLDANDDPLADPLLAQTGGFAAVANYLGCCALSLPCGTVGGLPFGVQLMAPPHQERRLLAIARAVEHAIRGS